MQGYVNSGHYRDRRGLVDVKSNINASLYVGAYDDHVVEIYFVMTTNIGTILRIPQ